MIPQTIGTLLAFLFLVAPGILFETLRERRRQSIDQTPFREASRIALASLCFTMASLVLLAIVRAVAPTIMPDPGRWLQQGGRYLQDNYQLVTGFFLSELVVAMILAAAWSRWLGRKAPPSIKPVSAWFKAFRDLRPADADVFVRVVMQGDTEYAGKVIGYTVDYGLTDRELHLGEPLSRRLPNETRFTPLHPPWRWLILPGPEINSISVSYLTRTPLSTKGGITSKVVT